MDRAQIAKEQFWRGLILLCLARLDKYLKDGIMLIGVETDVSVEIDDGIHVVDLFKEGIEPMRINTRAETPAEAFSRLPKNTNYKQLADYLIEFVEEELSYKEVEEF